VVLVASGLAGVDEAVEFEVPFMDVAPAEPTRRVRDEVCEVVCEVVVLLLPTEGVPIPKIVVEPNVVVSVVDPLVMIDIMADVEMAEEVVGTV
jgi:hypothetical protein